ncbi:RecQ family zinc-binding domain-containing protein [Algoriphagus sp. C2-6-M1]|uniref:RecQ family zinc-binding domain-containing protein n=1 Tax=Algoriphagus persicinus TaxID=3108754 RepID=UPI002B3727D2|nr:RecQ family zinc-binding domain-containing protein [Algoriphagus sp. C2-6-M1]MEB2781378.1 RecQ family zinc-binding domain-containing protein [Algoriphagus sp. C2-6-M1]
MRTYGGNVFSEYIKIQEANLAKSLNVYENELIKMLKQLEQLEVMVYDQRKDKPQITFLTPRYDAGKLPLNFKRIELRRALTLEKAQRVVKYGQQSELCRTQFIQEYFGENTDQQCGVCDICIAQRKANRPDIAENKLRNKIMETLTTFGQLTERDIFEHIRLPLVEKNLRVLRILHDQGYITLLTSGSYVITSHE